MSTPGAPSEDFAQERPHPGRVYDFYLGGTNNFGIDRQLAAQGMQAYPDVMVAARQNRSFMHRATRYAAEELGIEQFLDIGTGIPTEPNLHQVARRHRPTARVLYVDRDPLVRRFAHTLLTSARADNEGLAFLDADLHSPEHILEHAAEQLDFDRPIGLSLIAVLHFFGDDEDPAGVLGELVEALPAGSTLAFSHATADFAPEQMYAIENVYHAEGLGFRLRDREQISNLCHRLGLKLIAPGVVPSCDWRLDLDEQGQLPGMVTAAEAGVWVWMGQKV